MKFIKHFFIKKEKIIRTYDEFGFGLGNTRIINILFNTTLE
jgi:hypothetical protein